MRVTTVSICLVGVAQLSLGRPCLSSWSLTNRLPLSSVPSDSAVFSVLHVQMPQTSACSRRPEQNPLEEHSGQKLRFSKLLRNSSFPRCLIGSAGGAAVLPGTWPERSSWGTFSAGLKRPNVHLASSSFCFHS